jgi:uncharacterized protein YqgQ
MQVKITNTSSQEYGVLTEAPKLYDDSSIKNVQYKTSHLITHIIIYTLIFGYIVYNIIDFFKTESSRDDKTIFWINIGLIVFTFLVWLFMIYRIIKYTIQDIPNCVYKLNHDNIDIKLMRDEVSKILKSNMLYKYSLLTLFLIIMIVLIVVKLIKREKINIHIPAMLICANYIIMMYMLLNKSFQSINVLKILWQEIDSKLYKDAKAYKITEDSKVYIYNKTTKEEIELVK